MERFGLSRWNRSGHPLRSAIVGIGLSGIATLPAAAPGSFSRTSAALIYVLAVVGAATVGGTAAGVAASAASFLALNFFFTPPVHTLRVDKAEDLVALLVFLAVTVVIGLLVSSSITNRARSERREMETRLLNKAGNRLLAGESLENVLHEFADAMVTMLGLARCSISSPTLSQPVTISAPGTVRAGQPQRVTIGVTGRTVGEISAWPNEDDEIDAEGREVIEAFAGQLGLALESMRMADQAREAELKAEADELRAALLSSVTHDVRTPLASITASVTSLLHGDRTFSEAATAEHLETIREEALRLDRLLGNLLDLSRLRAGALVPKKVPLAIDEVIEKVVARSKRHYNTSEIHMEIREDLPEVDADIVQIDQLLTNLVENAAKFSPAGSQITISAMGGPNAIRVAVSDQGPGIPKERRNRVFEPFERGDDTTSGTGLGLAIARAVVVAHDGRIWVTGAPTGGAMFVFELPVGTDGRKQEEDAAPRSVV